MRSELVERIGLSLTRLGPFADLAGVGAMATGADLDLADAIVAAGSLRTAA